MAFNFNWNLPPVSAGFVDPQGVNSTIASSGMAGYRPASAGMEGYKPAEQGYKDYMFGLGDKKARLEELQRQLALMDAEIARLEGGSESEERELAAKLAEIGDTSLYQGILARGQNEAARRTSDASGIDNLLYEADKLSWGLDAQGEEDRRMTRQNIRATLERAKGLADKAGVSLPDKYYELTFRLGDADDASIVYESERRRANEWWDKARNKTLTKDDMEDVKEFIRKHPDSDAATKLRQLVEQYEPLTKEARAQAEADKARSDALYVTFSDFTDADEQARWFRGLPKKDRVLLKKYHDIDAATGKEGN